MNAKATIVQIMRIFSGDLGRNLSHIDAAIAFVIVKESGLEH